MNTVFKSYLYVNIFMTALEYFWVKDNVDSHD